MDKKQCGGRFLSGEKSAALSESKDVNEDAEPLGEFLGSGISAAPCSESGGSLEKNTLREVVEQMRLDVSKSDKKIRSMTFDEDREWIKVRIEELKLQHQTSNNDGPNASDSEESIQKIFSTLQRRSCVSCGIKLTNCSTFTLSSPLYHVSEDGGRKQRLPLWIHGGKKEAICFSGGRVNLISAALFCRDSCTFLCSFGIGTTLFRLTIFCWMDYDGYCQLGMGFFPTNLPLDEPLYSVLREKSFLPHNWVMSECRSTPVEIYSNQENYFVKGHMTTGPNSIVNVEIFESGVNPGRAISSLSGDNLDYLQRISSLIVSSDGVTCVMVVANGLNTSIKLRGCRSCARSSFSEVPPLGVEILFATAKLSIEAVIAYEIEGTDLGLIVAVKAKENENTFAALFLPADDFMFDDSLNALLEQSQWNCFLNQLFHSAKDGDQTIQTRNIRANVNMTEGQNSQVKIQLYAV